MRGLRLIILTLLLLVAAQPAPAAPPASPPPGGYEVHEWVVLVDDVGQSTINTQSIFGQSFPAGVGSRRPHAPGAPDRPMPCGVITFYPAAGAGAPAPSHPPDDQPGPPMSVILRPLHETQWYTDWPRAGTSNVSQLIWPRFHLAAAPTQLEPAQPGDWLDRLRRVPALYVTYAVGCERFLLYDGSWHDALPITAAYDGSRYRLGARGMTFHDLQAFHHTDAGWETAMLPRLGGDVAAGGGTSGGSGASGASGASGGEVLSFWAAGKDADGVVAPWLDRLKLQGLTAAEAGTVVEVLKAWAMDPDQMTVVLRLERADLDRLLPIEVTPAPAKLVRVGLVILRDFDPAVGVRVDHLILQLGDARWSAREDAQRRLQTIGEPARTRLESAAHSPDPEIAYRARQVLEAITP